jgi:hypothetical protein
MFWSTINSEWLPDWDETNSVPTRLKIEMAFKLNDGSAAQLADTHKREIVIFSDTITQAMQNPKMPASKSRGSKGRSGGRDSRGSRGQTPKPTADQMKRIAEWRKQREEAGKRDGGKRQYSEAEKAAYRKKMAERYAKYAKAKQAASGASRFTPPGGSNTPGGTSSGTPPSGGTSSGTPASGGGGVGLFAGSIPINEALELYESTFGQQAETLQDLVDTGVLTPEELGQMQSTAPAGAEWGVDPTTGLVTAVYP